MLELDFDKHLVVKNTDDSAADAAIRGRMDSGNNQYLYGTLYYGTKILLKKTKEAYTTP